MIDQNVPHQLRGHAKKVSAVLPLRRFLANQPQIGFVHQRSALEGVIGTFTPQMAARQTAQLAVNHGYQRIPRFFVASAPIGKQPIDPRRRRRSGAHVPPPPEGRVIKVESKKIASQTNKVNLPSDWVMVQRCVAGLVANE
jgi:hypothetical protein